MNVIMLSLSLYGGTEVGVDEAGRGPLAGSVFAAAVILPPDFRDDRLDDSKKMSEPDRYALREIIEREAVAWAVGEVLPEEIDQINILNASFLAMTRAVEALRLPDGCAIDRLLIDGNRFRSRLPHPFECIVKGDAKLAPIAAASVLAKTYRDDYMKRLHEQFPLYKWDRNKGYPTRYHREAVLSYGMTPHHRRSFCQKFTVTQSLLEF